MEYREYTGKTLEDAKAAAAAELGCAVEDLRVEVLEEEKGGFFGLFKSVKIRVECDESMIAPANVTEAVADACVLWVRQATLPVRFRRKLPWISSARF